MNADGNSVPSYEKITDIILLKGLVLHEQEETINLALLGV